MANKKSLIQQKNEISEGRCDWTIYMSRAYCKVTDMFLERLKVWKTMFPNGLDNKSENLTYADLFGKVPLKELLTFDIPRHALAVIGKDGKEDIPKVIDFKNAFSRLADVGIVEGRPDDEENWKRINIIGGVKYDKDTDSVHAEIVPMMVDYLLGLTRKYTAFNPWIAMKFQKSQYTFRFYEFCCQWRKSGVFSLTPRELKHRFELDEFRDGRGILHKEKYTVMRDFIRKVIEPAREELQELFDAGDCDVCFEYEPIYDRTRPGRPTVTRFDFVVVSREKAIEPPKKAPQPIQYQLWQDTEQRLRQLRETLRYYWSGSFDKNWPNKAINELGKLVVQDPALLPKVEVYVQDTIHELRKGKIKNICGTIHNYFLKQLGINVDPSTVRKGKRT